MAHSTPWPRQSAVARHQVRRPEPRLAARRSRAALVVVSAFLTAALWTPNPTHADTALRDASTLPAGAASSAQLELADSSTAVRDARGDVRIYRKVPGPSKRARVSIDIRRAEINDSGKFVALTVKIKQAREHATQTDHWDQIVSFDLTPAPGTEGGWSAQVSFASHGGSGYASISWPNDESWCDLRKKRIRVENDRIRALVPRRCLPTEAAWVRVTTYTSEFRTDARAWSRDRVRFLEPVTLTEPAAPRSREGGDGGRSTAIPSAREDDKRYGFRIKRGLKHYCTIDLNYTGGEPPWVTCFLSEYDYDPPPKGDCPLSWGSVMYVRNTGDGKFLCFGGLLYHPQGPLLGAKESFSKGRFRCTNKGPGVRCWNKLTGHGFRQSKSVWKTF